MYLCVCGRVRLLIIVLLVVPVQLLERECEEAVSTVRAQHEALIKELTAQHQHEVPPLIHILLIEPSFELSANSPLKGEKILPPSLCRVLHLDRQPFLYHTSLWFVRGLMP